MLARDFHKKLAFLTMTHMAFVMSEIWGDFADLFSILFNGEFYQDDSTNPEYNFGAFHFHTYNRYSMDVSILSHHTLILYIVDMNCRELGHLQGCIRTLSKKSPCQKENVVSLAIFHSVFLGSLPTSNRIQNGTTSYVTSCTL